MQTPSPGSLPTEEQVTIDKVITGRRRRPGALLGILEAAQERNRYKYLPPGDVALPRGQDGNAAFPHLQRRHLLRAVQSPTSGREHYLHLRGTACHTRGSRNLLQGARLDLGLGLDDGDGNGNEADKLLLTTPDRQFTVRTVASTLSTEPL